MKLSGTQIENDALEGPMVGKRHQGGKCDHNLGNTPEWKLQFEPLPQQCVSLSYHMADLVVRLCFFWKYWSKAGVGNTVLLVEKLREQYYYYSMMLSGSSKEKWKAKAEENLLLEGSTFNLEWHPPSGG